MREKFKTARSLRKSVVNYPADFKSKVLFLRCYLSFLLDCLLIGKDTFILVFKTKHSTSLSKRVADWGLYFYDLFYRFLLIHVFKPSTPNMSDRELQLYYHKPTIPKHLLVSNLPDEVTLRKFLRANGFDVKNKFLFPDQSIYEMSKFPF